MTDNDLDSKMRGYHSDEVTLGKTHQSEMRKRRNAGRTRLENGLEQNKRPGFKEIASQGSYQMRTMVQDKDNEYDIDDGVYFASADLVDEDGDSISSVSAREWVCEALKWDGRLKMDAEIKDNCVRQEYPEGYHIDMPVYRVSSSVDDAGDEVEKFELAAGETWTESDARAVTRWFNDKVGELNAGEPDGSQMRRVTKLTKRFSRSRSTWKKSTTSGICVTKLVVDHFVTSSKREDVALRLTWKAILKALDESTKIEHPVLVSTSLAEQGDSKVEFFRGCLADAMNTLNTLDKNDCDLKEACSAWNKVFNTSYFSDDDEKGDGGNSSGSNGRAAIIVTSDKTARRNDGGGRFG